MSHTPESLLRHASFVRALVKRMVFDADAVDDVVQETWLAALRQRGELRRLRPWLAAVARNAARKLVRSRIHRQRRERASARAEGTQSTAEAVARADLVRALMDAVVGLEEPYRTTVLLRYYEDLPPREIARRLGVSPETVRSRVRRGIEILRGRLDSVSGGDRRGWCLALLPLALPASASAGGAAFKAGVLGSILAVGVAVVVLRDTTDGEPLARSADVGRAGLIAEEQETGAAGDAPVEPRPSDSVRVVGRVVDETGRPIPDADVQVLFRRGVPGTLRTSGKTAQDGRFDLEGAVGRALRCTAWVPGRERVGSVWLVADEPGLLEVGSLRARRDHPIRGRVLDTNGDPVIGAELQLETEADPVPESWAVLENVATETQEGGAFVFGGLPPGKYRITIEYDDFVGTRYFTFENIEAGGQDSLFRVPPPRRKTKARLRMRVLAPGGSPLPKGKVFLSRRGVHQVTPIRNGVVDAVLSAEGPARIVIRAHEGGSDPVSLQPHVLRQVVDFSRPLEVRLRPGPEIRGRVLIGDRPARVRLYARSLAAGALHPRALEWETTSASDGTFRFSGLLPGRYAIAVRDPAYLAHPGRIVEAGTRDFVLKLSSSAPLEVTVVEPEGRPLRRLLIVVIRATIHGPVLHANRATGPEPNFPMRLPLYSGQRYRVRVWAVGADGGSYLPAEAAVIGGQRTLNVGLTRGPSVQGVVVRADGSPVAGARVRARQPDRILAGGTDRRFFHWSQSMAPSARTDGKGAFTLHGVTGSMLAAATAPGLGLIEAPVRVRPGARNVRLVVGPRRGFSGRVRSSEGSLENVQLLIWPETWSAGIALPESTWVQDDGFFSVSGLAPGKYRLYFLDDGGRTPLRCAVSKLLRAGTHDLRFDLAPGAGVEGVVTDAQGRPVLGATVIAAGAWGWVEAFTDRRGQFSVNGLPDGRYRVFARHRRRTSDEVTTETGRGPVRLTVRR